MRILFSVALFTYLVDSSQIVSKEIDRHIFMSLARCFLDSKFGGNLKKSDVCVCAVKRVQDGIRMAHSGSSSGLATVLYEGKGW